MQHRRNGYNRRAADGLHGFSSGAAEDDRVVKARLQKNATRTIDNLIHLPFKLCSSVIAISYALVTARTSMSLLVLSSRQTCSVHTLSAAGFPSLFYACSYFPLVSWHRYRSAPSMRRQLRKQLLVCLLRYLHRLRSSANLTTSTKRNYHYKLGGCD